MSITVATAVYSGTGPAPDQRSNVLIQSQQLLLLLLGGPGLVPDDSLVQQLQWFDGTRVVCSLPFATRQVVKSSGSRPRPAKKNVWHLQQSGTGVRSLLWQQQGGFVALI